MDQLSFSSTYIEIYFNDNHLASASGFIVSIENDYYLVTNWHVITGRNAYSKNIMSKEGAIPNKFIVHIFIQQLRRWQKLILNDPEFIEHPKENEIDVVLIPLYKLHMSLFCLNTDYQTDILITPGLPVHIIGYPGNKSAGSNLNEKFPIWTTGFIASEPYIDIDGLPKLYINASGYSGLSGGAVILRLLAGSYPSIKNNVRITNEYVTQFLGIYSGRLRKTDVSTQIDDDSSMQIGIVWKPIVIKEIYEHYKKHKKSKHIREILLNK